MSRLSELERARDLMWESIGDADADKRAPLMNQWRALEATIAELKSEQGKSGDPIDEIAARRSARGGSTARTRATRGREG